MKTGASISRCAASPAFQETPEIAWHTAGMIQARESTTILAGLLRREHGAMAEFLLALAEFDRQRLWLDLGYSGLFSFLHRELRMSKAAAFYRKTAAELVRNFPEIVEPLRDGRLCITAVVELAKVITVENRGDVLPRFFHCSKREAKAVSAALAPEEAPAHRDVVTSARVATPPAAVVRLDEPTHSQQAGAREVTPAAAAAPIPAPPPRAERDLAEPLTAELRRLHVTVSSRFLEKLEETKAALSHTHPAGRAEEILEAGLDLLLERQAKRNGQVKRPQEQERPSAPDHVPARVRRAVWERDGGRCQWPIDSGGVCGSTLRVELDHVQPQALGGLSTISNMRCLCRMHNDLAARRIFGDGHMDLFTHHDHPVAR